MADRRNGSTTADAGTTALPGDLVRAMTWLRAHLHEPVNLQSLADVAGVAPRTLENHFRQFLGTTPLGWLRQMRLMRARRALLDSVGRANVTQIALDSGFTQLGRFAADYRQQFGERPSQTLRRTRTDAGEEIDDKAQALTWHALSAAFAVAPQQCNAALEDLAQAQALAPTYGLPKALAAWCWSQRAAQHFSATPQDDMVRALALADEARALAPTDCTTLTLASGALTLAHRLDEADRLLDQALANDPWSAIAWLRRGWASAYYGDADAAIRQLRTTLHLMPFEPIRHVAFIGIGCAYFAAERYDRAARWIGEGVTASPGSFWATRIAVAAAMRVGAHAQGRRMARALLRKDPGLTVAVAQKAWPFPPGFMARLADGLTAAGVPRA